METPTNDTAVDLRTQTGDIVWCVTFSLEALVVLSTNSVTIIVFLSNAPLSRHTSFLLTNLAFADLLVGLFAIPGWVYFVGLNSLWHNEPSLAGCIAYSTLDIATAFASVTNHGSIAVERLVATLWPFKYKRHKRRLNVFLIVVSWVCAIVTPILTMVGFYVFNSKTFALFLWMPLLSVLLIINATSYSILLLRKRVINRELQLDPDDRRTQCRSHRFTITALIVTVVSLSAWLPFMIMSIVNLAVSINNNRQIVNPVKFLHFLNSLSNPFIYWLRLPRYKQTVYSVVFRCKKPRVLAPMASAQAPRPNEMDTRL